MIGFKLKVHFLLLHFLVKYGYSLVELTCDFSRGEGAIADANVSICVRRLNEDTKIEVICPKDVEGEIDYSDLNVELTNLEKIDRESRYQDLIQKLILNGVIGQEEESDGNEEYEIFPDDPYNDANVLAVDEFLSTVYSSKYNVWEIFGTKDENPISKVQHKNRQILTIKPPSDGVLTIKKQKVLIYTCIKRKYSDSIDTRFYEVLMNRSYFTTADSYYKIKLPILGNGNPNIRAGIAIVVLNRLPLVQTGCGNVENKFFTNISERNPEKGFTECKVDVMMNPNIGFYCEGFIQPPLCLETFINYYEPERIIGIDRDAITEDGRLGTSLIYTNYNLKELPAPFKGYCQCVDVDGNVSARLIVERKRHHEFDITQSLLKNKVRPMKDEWSTVALHPGDSMTIKFPPNLDHYQYQNFVKRMKRRQYDYDQPEEEEEQQQPQQQQPQQPGVQVTVDDFKEEPTIYELKSQNKSLEELATQEDGEETQDDSVSQSEDSKQEEKGSDASSKTEKTKKKAEAEGKKQESEDEQSQDESLIVDETSSSHIIVPGGSSEDEETPNYPFLTFLSPKFPAEKVNIFSHMIDSMTSVNISEVFAGDAFEVDDSQVLKGILKINFKKKPLARRSMVHSLSYYWVLKQRKQRGFEIVAKIIVKFAQLHNYSYGCETEPSGLFIPIVEPEHIKYAFNGLKMRTVKNHMFEPSTHYMYGINCSEDETLYPSNAGTFMIDNKSDLRFNVSVNLKSYSFPNLENFKQIKRRGDVNVVYSYRCGCIDRDGVERSRLMLYTVRPAFNACMFSLEDYRKIAFIPKVVMMLPYFEEEDTKMRSDVTNSLPEPERVPIPEDFPKQLITLTQGSKARLVAVEPQRLIHTITVEVDGTAPLIYTASFTLKGVRHERPLNRHEPYVDPSVSSKRLFPVNLTRYFYRIVNGNPRYLEPVEYSKMIATNVTGLTVSIRKLLNSPVLDHQTLYVVLPRGSVIIIKDPTLRILEMTFASGAISPPEEQSGDDLEGEESQQEEEPSTSERRGSTSWKAIKSLGKRRKTKIKRSDKKVRKEKEIRWAKTGETEQDQEEQEEEEEDIKELHAKKKKREDSEDYEDREEDKKKKKKRKKKKDVRRMEIWRLHTIVMESTNPWVRGCGVLQEGEDFFRPETEPLVERGKVVGCKVKIKPGEVVGFYCPAPYVVYPIDCFNQVYNEDLRRIEDLDRYPFTTIAHENRAFKYVMYRRDLKVRVRLLFEKNKKMVCYCRTITGKVMSKIEISL